jgi:hypothetical protein
MSENLLMSLWILEEDFELNIICLLRYKRLQML